MTEYRVTLAQLYCIVEGKCERVMLRVCREGMNRVWSVETLGM